jgi:hypothetical protein
VSHVVSPVPTSLVSKSVSHRALACGFWVLSSRARETGAGPVIRSPSGSPDAKRASHDSRRFSRAYVIHCSPLLLPGLSACLPVALSKIIPRIFRDYDPHRAGDGPRPVRAGSCLTRKPRWLRADWQPWLTMALSQSLGAVIVGFGITAFAIRLPELQKEQTGNHIGSRFGLIK